MVVNGSCGRAETGNTEMVRVIDTAKMVDFIMVKRKKRGLYEIVLERLRNIDFTLAKPCPTLSLY